MFNVFMYPSYNTPMDNSIENTKGFFSHVFRFDDDSKQELTNLMQYSILSIIPVILLNKAMQKYIPEADPRKGSLELSIEIIIQVMLILVGLVIVHRVVSYVPSYSGAEYPDIHLIVSVVPLLFIVLGFQTKLGEKSAILWDRVQEAWSGTPPSAPMKEPMRPSMQPTSIHTELDARTNPVSTPPEMLPMPSNEPEFAAANESIGSPFGSAW